LHTEGFSHRALFDVPRGDYEHLTRRIPTCAIAQAAVSDRKELFAARGELRQQLGEWYTASGYAKAEAAMQFCAELLESGVKLLVFAHHLQVRAFPDTQSAAACNRAKRFHSRHLYWEL
jgi:hypothetical protein